MKNNLIIRIMLLFIKRIPRNDLQSSFIILSITFYRKKIYRSKLFVIVETEHYSYLPGLYTYYIIYFFYSYQLTLEMTLIMNLST